MKSKDIKTEAGYRVRALRGGKGGSQEKLGFRSGLGLKTEFGKRVRDLRKRAGLSQEELAGRCQGGIEMQHVSEIELGERNCTLQTIERLAKGLNCDPAELFLFDPMKVGKALSALDARVLDLWKGADEKTKRKAIRILSELL